MFFLFLAGDGSYFAAMVYIGYFFLCILQIISILGGDKSPILVNKHKSIHTTWMKFENNILNYYYIIEPNCQFTITLHPFFAQDVLIAVFGFIFYLSIGAVIIDRNYCGKKGKALGSLSIIASFVYLGDTAFGAFAVMKS